MTRLLDKACPEAAALLQQGVITPQQAWGLAKLRSKDRPVAIEAAWAQ